MMGEAEVDKLIAVAARAAASRPAFLGWVLSEYRRLEGLDDGTLARQLGIEPEMLPSLCLCLRPRSERFLKDVEEIASAHRCDADALISVVRHVEFLDVARDAGGPGKAGRLLAARSRPPKRRHRGKGGGKP
jgi:hypothetical protein